LPVTAQARAKKCRIPANSATEARSDALATPQPPSPMSRLACTHAAADTGVPTCVFHVARWVTVIPSAKAGVWRTGRVRRAYCTFAGPRQLRLSACADCVCAKPPTAEHVCADFAPNLPK